MYALLIQHGCEAALEVLPANMEAQTKDELNKKAHSAMILCLGKKVLRQVTGETTAAGVWTKIETLYMRKSLANKLCLNKMLYTFYMPARRKIFEHIDEFYKIVLDFVNIKHDLWEDVLAILNSKEIKEMSKAKGDDGEGLYMRGRTDHKDSHQSRGKSRSKSRGDDGDERTALLDRIMDSGCSYQMTPRLDILFDFLEYDGGSVQLGDNRECKIRGIGKERIQLRDGSSFVLHNVMYIPKLKRNLILLGTLEKEGFAIKLQSGKVKVINGFRVVLSKIRRDNCVYYLDCHAMAGELNASVEEKDSLAQVWHKRLGHISKAGLQVLEKQGLFGKKSLVENQTGRTVKKLRTDNGLEFCNREFEQLCIESGIARHLIVVEMPQQNRVAERMNRILMDKVHCVLIQSGLPKTFWAEATCTAVYLINRSPLTAIEKKPMEMLDDESPKIVTSRNVVFNESVMYKDTLKDSGAGTDKSIEELQVELELQRLNNHTLEEDQTYQEDDDDEDSNMAAYTFVSTEEEDTHEPLTYQEAVACEDSSKWKAAMKEEIDSLRKNKTWDLVDHPARQKLVELQMAASRKGGLKVFKSLVTRKLEQLDVNTAFLHGNLEEVIYMRQPPGYEQDDMLIACKSKAKIRFAKSLLKKEFDIKELREAKKILDKGKSVQMPLGRHFKLSVKDCPVRDCNVERMSKVMYANAIRSLMYLMVCTRPEIVYAIWQSNMQQYGTGKTKLPDREDAA
ncbi:retrotransposon protein, putative, ty1-copia subclass [Tanacetum coccineum]